jgi:acetylornithine deacetylase/succinyl-diaminopimelate desuccinylase-like protein
VPGESQSEAHSALRELVGQVDADAAVVGDRQDWSWERIRERGIGSCSIDPSSPVVGAVEKAIRSVTGDEPTRIVQSAWCETDFLVNDLGIPTVNFGPGQMELAHTSTECISIQSLIRGVEILAQSICELCVA